MKVKQLIAHLEEQDPEAEVLIMNQRNWPFEHTVFGVTARWEVEQSEEDYTGEPPPEPRPDGSASTDVFIVEGSLLRYGSKTAWEVVAR